MIDAEDDEIMEQVQKIYDPLLEIFSKAKAEGITTHEASLRLAEERIMRARKLKVAAKRSNVCVSARPLRVVVAAMGDLCGYRASAYFINQF